MSTNRTSLNDNQKSVLKQTFANSAYLTKETMKNLSQQLGLSEKTVSRWFSTKRRFSRKRLHGQPSSKNMHVYLCFVHSFIYVFMAHESRNLHQWIKSENALHIVRPLQMR